MGLDNGSYSIKQLRVSRQNNKYRIEAFANATSATITKSKTKVNVAIAVPDTGADSHVIQVKAADTQKEQEILILLEAERHISCSLEEAYFDYQVIGKHPKDTNLLDVLFIASRKDYVYKQVMLLEDKGYLAKKIDIYSFTIARAFTHLIDNQQQQIVAIADIGASSLVLTILEKGRAIFTQCKAFGGHQLTQNIQQCDGIAMDEADRIKQAHDQFINYAAEALLSFKKRLVIHIKCILQLFSSHYPQLNIEALLLAGGRALIPNLSTYLAHELNLQVSLADPISCMEIAPHLDANLIKKSSPTLLLACGLALTAHHEQTSINLLPWRSINRQREKRLFLLALIFSVMVGILIVLSLHDMLVSKTEYQLSKNNKIKQEISKLDSTLKKIDNLKDKSSSLEKRMLIFKELQNKQFKAFAALTAINNNIPDTILLKKIQYEGNSVTIYGEANSYDNILLFMKNIEKTKLFADFKLREVADNNTYGNKFSISFDTMNL
jgi:type IV pilus assembly protein PilM